LIIRFLLALAFLWQLAAALLMSPDWIAAFLTHDDTYLALQVARGWAQNGFPTFDGIHWTNGFQPLWGLILLGLASIVNEPIALLRATLVVAALFNTATGLLVTQICRQVQPASAPLAVISVALWCAYCVSGKPALIALENALLPTLCAGTLLMLFRIWTNAARIYAWLALGLLCAALLWTRLDALVLIGGCLLVAFVAARRAGRWSGLMVALGVLVAATGGYIAFEGWAGGTNTPVSGLVKRAIAERIEPEITPTVAASAVRDAGNVVLKHAAIGIGLFRPQALSSGGRAAILLLLAWALVRTRSDGVRWVGATALLLFAHALGLRLWLSAYFHDTPWYYSAVNVLAGIGVAILVLDCFPPRWHRRITIAAVALFMLRLIASCWMLTWRIPPEAAGPVRIAAATWLRENVPGGERVAGWNAGELAYFSCVTLINLDGLVNDADFYRDIVRGQGSIDEYLKAQRVNWVADYAAGAENESKLWDTLPADEWSVVARFGDHAAAQQLVARRRVALATH
jgi:hypothetical protein